MIDKHIILGVHVHNRVEKVPAVQTLFTEYGCHIRTRLGLHGVSDGSCSPNGLILVELVGDEAKCHELATKLAALEGVYVQKMVYGIRPVAVCFCFRRDRACPCPRCFCCLLLFV
jgi:hypothetical protein